MKVISRLMQSQQATDLLETGLTGRIRHRAARRWYGPIVLILQVEVEVKAGDGCRAWRDAKVEDLGELGIPDRA